MLFRSPSAGRRLLQGNPDKRPVNAIDDFVKKAKKIEAKESDAFDPWEH